MSIAEESIPKTSSNKKHKSWFNDNCKTAIRLRKVALRSKFNLQPSAKKFNNFNIHRAKTRRIIKTSKKTSYRNYVNKLKVEECKSHVLIRTLSYFSKWKR